MLQHTLFQTPPGPTPSSLAAVRRPGAAGCSTRPHPAACAAGGLWAGGAGGGWLGGSWCSKCAAPAAGSVCVKGAALAGKSLQSDQRLPLRATRYLQCSTGAGSCSATCAAPHRSAAACSNGRWPCHNSSSLGAAKQRKEGCLKCSSSCCRRSGRSSSSRAVV